MTPEEIICEFMEPRPSFDVINSWRECSSVRWWRFYNGNTVWIPILLTLDRLRQVEERLTAEQWDKYEVAMIRIVRKGRSHQDMLHASAEQKIAAMAKVIGCGK